MIAEYLLGDGDRYPGDDVSLVETGIIDSTGILEMIDFIAEKFGVRMSDDEAVPENLESVDNIVRFVLSRTR